jgi:hypothetical protein
LQFRIHFQEAAQATMNKRLREQKLPDNAFAIAASLAA